jgi:hypothetical protein
MIPVPLYALPTVEGLREGGANFIPLWAATFECFYC